MKKKVRIIWVCVGPYHTFALGLPDTHDTLQPSPIEVPHDSFIQSVVNYYYLSCISCLFCVSSVHYQETAKP
jgi:hypothetical protein